MPGQFLSNTFTVFLPVRSLCGFFLGGLFPRGLCGTMCSAIPYYGFAVPGASTFGFPLFTLRVGRARGAVADTSSKY